MNWIRKYKGKGMNNYTMIYIVMIIVGIIMVVWIKGQSRKKMDPLPPPPLDPPSPLSPPPIQIADDINRIYIYSASEKSKKGHIWVCGDCELENKGENEYCFFCGSSKTGGR